MAGAGKRGGWFRGHGALGGCGAGVVANGGIEGARDHVYGSVRNSTLAGLWRHGFSFDAYLDLRMGTMSVGFRQLGESQVLAGGRCWGNGGWGAGRLPCASGAMEGRRVNEGGLL